MGTTEDLHPADVELLERLGAIADIIDPVPAEVLLMGRAAFAFRDPDAELMKAVATDAPELAGVRLAATTSRLHFFEFGELSIDLEVTTHRGFAKLLGVVTDPAGTAGRTMTVDSRAASFTTEVDPSGRFTFAQVPAGLIRLQIDGSDSGQLVTRWFEAG